MIEAPAPLPHPLAGPLHFPSAAPWAWKLALALLAVALLWQLLRRLLRRRERAPKPPWAPPPPPPRQILPWLESIRERHLRQQTYRQGCHELSHALRAHWEQKGLAGAGRHEFRRLTAREIARLAGDGAAGRFLGLLSALQFGRRPPQRGDFEGACELAREVVRGGGAR